MGTKGTVNASGDNPHKHRDKRVHRKRERQSCQAAKARKDAEREQRFEQKFANHRHRHSVLQYFGF